MNALKHGTVKPPDVDHAWDRQNDQLMEVGNVRNLERSWLVQISHMFAHLRTQLYA